MRRRTALIPLVMAIVVPTIALISPFRASADTATCGLADPAFWDGGLSIIEQQLEAAEAAAVATGRLGTSTP